MARRQENLQVDVFQAISDPTRRSLLDLVAVEEQLVNKLAKAFAMTRPAILKFYYHASTQASSKIRGEHVWQNKQ